MVHDSPEGEFIVCYEFTEEEIKILRRTRQLWFGIYTFGLPLQPILPMVNVPFKRDEVETGPEKPFEIYYNQ